MKKIDLSKAVSNIDEKLIEEAEGVKPKRKFSYKIISVAAMLALTVTVGSVVFLNRNTILGGDSEDTVTSGGSVFGNYEAKENKAGEYKSGGENGEIFADGLTEGDVARLYDKEASMYEGELELAEPGDMSVGATVIGEAVVGNSNGITAGTLTAGYTDDNNSFASFKNLFGENWRDYISARPFVNKDRVVVTAEGCNNAPVALLGADGAVVAYGRSNSSGVAYLYCDDSTAVKTAVIKTAEGEKQTAVTDGSAEFTGLSTASPTELDLMLMVDTTGSMGDELEYLKAELKDMVNRIAEKYTGMNVRVSVNFYRDRGDEYVVRFFPFTDSIDEAVENISAQYSDGGGDFPEAVDEALVNVTEHAWRENSVKVCFFVLDAPAHAESDRQGVNSNIEKALADCAKNGIRVVPVVCSGVDEDAEMTLRTMAAYTGGRYIYLTDHSGVGGTHKSPDDVESDVYALNELMIDTVSYYVDGSSTMKPRENYTVGEFSFAEVQRQTANATDGVKREGFVNVYENTISSPTGYVNAAKGELEAEDFDIITVACDYENGMYRVSFKSDTSTKTADVYMTENGVTKLIVFGE